MLLKKRLHDKVPDVTSDEFECITTANRQAPFLDGRTTLALPWAEVPHMIDVHGSIIVSASGTTLHVINTARKNHDNKFLNWSVADSITAIRLSKGGDTVWVGTETGEMLQIDTGNMTLTEHRTDAHRSSIKLIQRCGNGMVSLDQDGILVHWHGSAQFFASLRSPSTRFKLPAKPSFVQLLHDQLWILYTHTHTSLRIICRLIVCQLGMHAGQETKVANEEEWMHGWHNNTWGIVTCMAITPCAPHYIFMGHASGHVTVWDRSAQPAKDSKRVSHSPITAIEAPSRFLWIGLANGQIHVLDALKAGGLPLLKYWQAHEKHSPIATLAVDSSTLTESGELCVYSNGMDHKLHFWDGLLSQDWESRILDSEVSQYSTSSHLKLAHLTFNVGAAEPSKLIEVASLEGHDLLHNFLNPWHEYDVISFGLQEVVDLENVNLAFQIALFASPDHPMTDRYRKWRHLLKSAVGADFTLLWDGSLLYSCVFIRRTLKPRLRDVAHVVKKTGLDGDWGNKGAILLRFVVEDTSIVLINNHLAAGEGAVGKRRRDVRDILDEARFPLPSSNSKLAFTSGGDGTCVADHEVVIFAGDLNFRVIDIKRDQVLELLANDGNKSTTIKMLLEHDELSSEMKHEPPFQQHGFQEQAIAFQPTYKYDTGLQVFDTSEKKRMPSWCDRILYRSDRPGGIVGTGYKSYQDITISDHRPVSATFDILIKTVNRDQLARTQLDVKNQWSDMKNSLLDLATSFYKEWEDGESSDGYVSSLE
ncbi:hypothetical protein OIV83_001409 [Microbotryomycetes sp. JL201]|nr:hypothetical protein OIV83_001409 [Microbotryomycetes sp. JL201]